MNIQRSDRYTLIQLLHAKVNLYYNRYKRRCTVKSCEVLKLFIIIIFILWSSINSTPGSKIVV